MDGLACRQFYRGSYKKEVLKGSFLILCKEYQGDVALYFYRTYQACEAPNCSNHEGMKSGHIFNGIVKRREESAPSLRVEFKTPDIPGVTNSCIDFMEETQSSQ